MSDRLPVSRARSTGTEIVPGGLRVRRDGHGARGPALPGGPLLSGRDCYYRYYLRPRKALFCAVSYDYTRNGTRRRAQVMEERMNVLNSASARETRGVSRIEPMMWDCNCRSVPGRFWQERHLLPLDDSTPFNPHRGRYCLDDACLRLEDADDLSVVDAHFDYVAYGANLRRPVPCPPGQYCQPGTAVATCGGATCGTFGAAAVRRVDVLPGGSESPSGVGSCPRGHYCPFGVRLACPAGAFCPRDGLSAPIVCEPGFFNGMVGQVRCTACPRGAICPGFGRIQPAICPPGYACSRERLAAPNMRCPRGHYCPNGTVTADPQRNDTTLRPYPCTPGTYCLAGVGDKRVKKGDYAYAQPCFPGFYCESASVDPKGSGECPAGFYCPEGTGSTDPHASRFLCREERDRKSSEVSPGKICANLTNGACKPCPPGTACENDGMAVATICSPGFYRSIEFDDDGEEVDGLPCRACPQGSWSKNWELREVGECSKCPTGVVCSVDAMTVPCNRGDLPTPYEPVGNLDGAP